MVLFRRTLLHADRSLAKLVLGSLLALMAPSAGACAADSDDSEDGRTQRPNVLLIVVDDQSPLDFRFYNPRSVLEAPTLERLAAEGMVIDAAHHLGSYAGAVCTPSRHMIMSGRSLWHLPNAVKKWPGRGPDASADAVADLPEQTLAAVFNRAGYQTVRTCKAGNSYRAANRQFQIRHDATKRGPTDATGSPWHAEQVLDYFHQRGKTPEAERPPFLVYLGFSHPHDTRDGQPDLLAKYGAQNHTDRETLPPADPRQPPLPVDYLPAHPFPHGHPRLRDEVRVSGVWERRDERTIRNEIGRQLACAELIDRQVGRVLQRLDSLGEADRTYIIYTSDHGIAIGRHGLQGKQNLYEHTWRVPMLAKGPGISAGSRAKGNVYLADLLATICDLTGVPTPETNQGSSFAGVLRGRQQAIRDVLYGAYCGGTKPGMRCVKRGDWKLIQYDVLDGKVRQTQLFDLSRNPNELLIQHHVDSVVALTGNKPEPNQVNLADDPQYARKLAEMKALLLEEMKRRKDPFRLWDQPVRP